VSIWLWCSRYLIIPYSYNKHDAWFSFTLHCCKQTRAVERGNICMVGSGRQSASAAYATAMEHAVVYYLFGSKCKPNSCQKVYYSNRPRYFFFVSTGEQQAKLLKLVLDLVSKFGWVKQITILLSNFKIVLSFFKSLNLSPLNSKYLENSKSIYCRVERKELGTVQVTLPKTAKLYVLVKMREICAEEIWVSVQNISLLPSVKIKSMQWNRWVVDRKIF